MTDKKTEDKKFGKPFNGEEFMTLIFSYPHGEKWDSAKMDAISMLKDRLCAATEALGSAQTGHYNDKYPANWAEHAQCGIIESWRAEYPQYCHHPVEEAE